MKKLLIGGLTFLTMLGLCSFCGAETVGNAIDINIPPGRGVYSARLAEYVSINVGWDSELLWGKDLNDGKNISGTVTSTDVELEGMWHMARISCTLFDRFQPYFKMGISNLQMNWREAGEDIEAEADSAGAFGIGTKVLLMNFEDYNYNVKLTGSASLRRTDSDVQKVSGKTIYSSKFEIREWQAALGLSTKFEIPAYEDLAIIPYIGGVYSDTKTRVRFSAARGDGATYNPGGDGNVDNFGLFIGCDALIASRFSLNLEGRFIDQTAASIGFSTLF